ncbi:unnamed protein product [Taenia asiatica]|uniref:T-box domain-containing protein n=1 Tax=Taenia asiatica TaxID=60517 RepID=A0A0R3VZQ0_TAEAS|nr:unnamed protein product [Taenia asiatica]
MAGASGEGEDRSGDEAPVRVLMEENIHSALLTIAESVPSSWPIGLNFELREFSSICIAGRDYVLACLAQRPTITLHLRDQAAWSAASPCLMEMRIDGIYCPIGSTNVVSNLLCRRVYPALSVRVEGLLADGLYTIFLDLMPMSWNVYKYQDGRWISLQTAIPYPPPNLASLICVSSIPVRLGSALMAYGMDFSFAKITADIGPPINRNEVIVLTVSACHITAS